MIEAGIGKIVLAVLAGRGEAEHGEVPVEVAFVPTEHERSEGGVALGELMVDGGDCEGRYVEGPKTAGTGKGHPGKRGADIDIHLQDALRERDGVGAP
jgi:hypothetical protein